MMRVGVCVVMFWRVRWQVCKSEWRSEEKDEYTDTHIKGSFDILYQGNQREVKSSSVFTNTHTYSLSGSDLILLDVFRSYTHFLVNIPMAPVVIAGFDALPEEGLAVFTETENSRAHAHTSARSHSFNFTYGLSVCM